ncbi:MAG: hypothetical protein ABIA12_01335 [Candidatus Aenigmatarchaeota archaeon]
MPAESFKIIDDVLTPIDKLMLEYKGPNPFKVYGAIPKLMQIIFHGRGKNVFEDKFKWDITSDPRDFYFLFTWDDDKFDRFSKPKFTILGLGKQPSDPNNPNGALYMELKGRLETEYKFKRMNPVLGAIERSATPTFVWMYHRLIYSAVRRRYIQIMKERIYKISDAIRKELGVTLEQPDLTGADVRVSKLPI